MQEIYSDEEVAKEEVSPPGVSTQLNNELVRGFCEEPDEQNLALQYLRDPNKGLAEARSILENLGVDGAELQDLLEEEGEPEDSDVSGGDQEAANSEGGDSLGSGEMSGVEEEEECEEDEVEEEQEVVEILQKKESSWTQRVAQAASGGDSMRYTLPGVPRKQQNVGTHFRAERTEIQRTNKPAVGGAREFIREASSDWTEVDGADENKDQYTRKVKSDLLRLLSRKFGGPKFLQERGLSMNSTLVELRYEEECKDSEDQEDDSIVGYKEWTRIVFGAIETANRRFGPFLELDGWTNHFMQDFNRVDRPLRLLHRKYFGKASMSPTTEIMWIVLGSIVAFHLNKRLGNDGGAEKAAPPPADRRRRSDEYEDEGEDISPPPTEAAHVERKTASKGGAENMDLAALMSGVMPLLTGGGAGGAGGAGGGLGNLMSFMAASGK